MQPLEYYEILTDWEGVLLFLEHSINTGESFLSGGQFLALFPIAPKKALHVPFTRSIYC